MVTRAPRSRSSRRIAALAALLALVLAGCQPAPYSSGSGPRVFYTGDSLPWDSDAELAWRFWTSGAQVARADFPGTTIGWSADRIRDQVWGDGGRLAPDLVVIASGNMNVADGWSEADAAETARTLDWAWPEGRCTVWVLPATVRHPGPPGAKESVVDADAVEVVDGIRRTAQTRPSTRIADWGTYAAPHPEWYAADGVHHTDAGKAAYAAYVVDRTRERCGL